MEKEDYVADAAASSNLKLTTRGGKLGPCRRVSGAFMIVGIYPIELQIKLFLLFPTRCTLLLTYKHDQRVHDASVR